MMCAIHQRFTTSHIDILFPYVRKPLMTFYSCSRNIIQIRTRNLPAIDGCNNEGCLRFVFFFLIIKIVEDQECFLVAVLVILRLIIYVIKCWSKGFCIVCRNCINWSPKMNTYFSNAIESLQLFNEMVCVALEINFIFRQSFSQIKNN